MILELNQVKEGTHRSSYIYLTSYPHLHNINTPTVYQTQIIRKSPQFILQIIHHPYPLYRNNLSLRSPFIQLEYSFYLTRIIYKLQRLFELKVSKKNISSYRRFSKLYIIHKNNSLEFIQREISSFHPLLTNIP